jgi:uncharacterized protein (DUF1499 family)
MLSSLLAVLAVLVLVFAGLGWWSARSAPAAPGLVNGRLAACDAAPHCVCSDAGDSTDTQHWIAAIALPALADDARWRVIREVVAASGGALVREEQAYLHATYTSRLLRFVDDVELRVDGAQLQVRSASRVGYSDLGANRKRVEALRARFMLAFAGAKS